MDVKSYAYYLLTKKDYFEEELRSKLIRKGFKDSEVECVISELKEKGILNDEKLLQRAKERAVIRGDSKAKFTRRLYSKSVRRVDLSFEEELESALNLLERSFRREKTFQEVFKFLKNRGFSYSVIQEATELFLKGER
ncbi:MAG: recombination regulator RecX [Hydrogenothermaceae bacterium]|nr:recombination regulator RecX [Hydrogenothermaceae bacterium]